MPVPKRSEAILGHPHHAKGEGPRSALERGPSGGKPKIPPVNLNWEPIAQGWYRSLALSGQSKWFEASDWALAYVAADILSEASAKGYPANLTGEWSAITSRLLCAEGDRRRMRIELIRAGGDPDEEAANAAVAEWDGKLKPV
jgi:hypothetical protein